MLNVLFAFVKLYLRSGLVFLFAIYISSWISGLVAMYRATWPVVKVGLDSLEYLEATYGDRFYGALLDTYEVKIVLHLIKRHYVIAAFLALASLVTMLLVCRTILNFVWNVWLSIRHVYRLRWKQHTGVCLESIRDGSPILETEEIPLPRSQVSFLDSDDVFVGSGIRVSDDKIMVPTHVLTLLRGKGSLVGPQTSVSLASWSRNEVYPEVTLLDVGAKTLTEMGVSKAKVASLEGEAFVRIVAPGRRKGLTRSSVGNLRESQTFGLVEYAGSTEPGFSGAAYLNGNIVIGMHIGGGQQNFGVEVEFALVLDQPKTSESPILDVITRELKKRGGRKAIRKSRLPPTAQTTDLVAVKYRGRYYVVEDTPELDVLEEENPILFFNDDRDKADRYFGDLISKVPRFDPGAPEYKPSKILEGSWPVTPDEKRRAEDEARRLAQAGMVSSYPRAPVLNMSTMATRAEFEEPPNHARMLTDTLHEMPLHYVQGEALPQIGRPVPSTSRAVHCPVCSRVFQEERPFVQHYLASHTRPEAAYAQSLGQDAAPKKKKNFQRGAPKSQNPRSNASANGSSTPVQGN